jgi:hypothetical protein
MSGVGAINMYSAKRLDGVNRALCANQRLTADE